MSVLLCTNYPTVSALKSKYLASHCFWELSFSWPNAQVFPFLMVQLRNQPELHSALLHSSFVWLLTGGMSSFPLGLPSVQLAAGWLLSSEGTVGEATLHPGHGRGVTPLLPYSFPSSKERCELRGMHSAWGSKA